MERRTFLRMTAGLALLPAVATAEAAAQPAAREEAVVLMRRLMEWCKAFGNPRIDRDYYRSFMTDDYLLLEHGELLDLEGDMAMLQALPADHVRTDRFDFRRVHVDGDDAYLVYFLESEMNDAAKGPRLRRWLESAIMRRANGEWRAAVLHSTRIEPTAA